MFLPLTDEFKYFSEAIALENKKTREFAGLNRFCKMRYNPKGLRNYSYVNTCDTCPINQGFVNALNILLASQS
jgi:hypothetical protein